MIRRIVRLEFHPEKIGEFMTFFNANRKTIAAFPGVISLDFYKDASLDNVYYTFSIWESEEALELYRDSEIFKSLWGFAKQRFSGKPLAYSLAELP
jgi:quinol monooxygenase YgiN